MNAEIELIDISKTFAGGNTVVRAVDRISLTIPDASFWVVAGSSSSGKTTLLNMIGGMERPDSGELRVGDHRLHRMKESALSRYRRYHVGFVFQGDNLISALTVYENIELPLLLTGKQKRRNKIMDLLKAIGMETKETAMPQQLSGGERQRVAIARALVHTPEVVLADEPTAHLDSKTAQEILSLLKQLHNAFRTTVLFATHDPMIIDQCDQVIRLEDGRVVNCNFK